MSWASVAALSTGQSTDWAGQVKTHLGPEPAAAPVADYAFPCGLPDSLWLYVIYPDTLHEEIQATVLNIATLAPGDLRQAAYETTRLRFIALAQHFRMLGMLGLTCRFMRHTVDADSFCRCNAIGWLNFVDIPGSACYEAVSPYSSQHAKLIKWRAANPSGPMRWTRGVWFWIMCMIEPKYEQYSINLAGSLGPGADFLSWLVERNYKFVREATASTVREAKLSAEWVAAMYSCEWVEWDDEQQIDEGD